MNQMKKEMHYMKRGLKCIREFYPALKPYLERREMTLKAAFFLGPEKWKLGSGSPQVEEGEVPFGWRPGAICGTGCANFPSWSFPRSAPSDHRS